MAKFVLVLPLKAPLLSSNDQRRAHWREVQKAKADTELIVGAAIKKARLLKLVYPISVRLVWYAPTAHRRDPDSLGPMLKACIDALVKKELIPDDSGAYVYEAVMGPVIISRDRPRFELIIVEGAGDLPDGGH
jgi:Holliday junction resolvase RusA-like endonuclease